MNTHSASVGMDAPAKKNKFKDLGVRSITGCLLGLFTLCVLWYGGLAFTFFIAFCSIVMLHEWRDLVRNRPSHFLLLGVPYILLPCFSLIGLRMIYYEDFAISMWPTFYVIAIVVVTDIGAYVAGRMIGGAKLAPRISPNKTWAGLMGGMSCATLASTAMLGIAPLPQGLMDAIAIGLCLSLIAQMGDLFESWMKRQAGVKDSGHILPGHGGLLDRVDGLLFAAPIYFALNLAAGAKIL